MYPYSRDCLKTTGTTIRLPSVSKLITKDMIDLYLTWQKPDKARTIFTFTYLWHERLSRHSRVPAITLRSQRCSLLEYLTLQLKYLESDN